MKNNEFELITKKMDKSFDKINESMINLERLNNALDNEIKLNNSQVYKVHRIIESIQCNIGRWLPVIGIALVLNGVALGIASSRLLMG